MILQTSETTFDTPEPPFIRNQIPFLESRSLRCSWDITLAPAPFGRLVTVLKMKTKTSCRLFSVHRCENCDKQIL